MRPSFVILVGLVAAAAPALSQTTTTPPPAPRAVIFSDTLGAGFSIADSATRTGNPGDFDFLVGMWEFTFQQRRADGTFSPPFRGHWSATKKAISNAFVEDHFRSDNPLSPIESGTWTYRVFNPQRKLWAMEGAESGGGNWAPGICWSDAGNRYVVQYYGSTIMRIRYLAITDTSFLWRGDASDDGGKTWHLDWWTMRTHRIGK